MVYVLYNSETVRFIISRKYYPFKDAFYHHVFVMGLGGNILSRFSASYEDSAPRDSNIQPHTDA